ncbi:uncharacterized protein LOC144614309 [Panthera onca]
MPTFSRQLKSHLNPSSRRGGGGGRCKTLPVALHESSAERVSPSPRHPQRRRRRRAPSSVSLKPPLPAPLSPLGPPPTPLGPFQTPWARGGCSVSKRWPRLGPGRRGSERGGGGAPGTVSPATRRGRARRDAGSSRSTAGARRRHWQREPRDRSITGSHGARAFSSLRAGASARHTSSGRKGPAPEPPRRAAGCALAQRGASCSRPLPPQPARPHPAAPAARAGGGRRQRRLLSRRRWWPDGLVQATAADAVQRNERPGSEPKVRIEAKRTILLRTLAAAKGCPSMEDFPCQPRPEAAVSGGQLQHGAFRAHGLRREPWICATGMLWDCLLAIKLRPNKASIPSRIRAEF